MHTLIRTYELNERLIEAVQRGNLHNVLECLRDGAKATLHTTSCGRTAIGVAALLGDVEILKLLIKSCLEPEAELFKRKTSNSNDIEIDTTPDGMDLLEWEDEFLTHYANGNGNVTLQSTTNEDDENEASFCSLYDYYAKTLEQTAALITSSSNLYSPTPPADSRQRQEDISCVDKLHMTALHYAAACGHVDCVRTLIAHGALVNVINSDGFTPLHVGVNHSEVVSVLLQHGANPNAKTISNEETPLHLAIRGRAVVTTHMLLQAEVDINETDNIGRTPLMWAILMDLDSIVMTLLKKGARVNLHDMEGHTALYYAVMRNNVAVAARLLQRGARHIISHYLVHHCVRANMREMLVLLVGSGENINIRNKNGLTPISLAILEKRADILQYLLKVAAQMMADHPALSWMMIDCIENQLIFAVQFTDTLKELKPIARVIQAHEGGRLSTPIANAPMSTSTGYYKAPLTMAVTLHKFDIAEFLLKEGMGISPIFMDQLIGKLRTANVEGSLELAQLLVYAGFKYTCVRPPYPQTWSPENIAFEEQLFQLCGKPLPLQSLARVVIRRQLLDVWSNSPTAQQKYPTTKHKVGISRMIEVLGLPRKLQSFLRDFDDCPSLMNFDYTPELSDQGEDEMGEGKWEF